MVISHGYYIKEEVLEKAIRKSLKYRKTPYRCDGNTIIVQQVIDGKKFDVEIRPNEGSIQFITCIDSLASGNPDIVSKLKTINRMNKDFCTEGTFFIDEERGGSIFYKILMDKIIEVPALGEPFLYLEELTETLEDNISYIRDCL